MSGGHRSSRITRWVKDEQGRPRPVPTNDSLYSLEELKALQLASGSNEYIQQRDHDGNLAPGEERYANMTCYEVAQDRRAQAMARGDSVALKQWEDRVLGMPKQQIEQTNVNLSFAEIAAERINAGALGFKTVRDELIEQGVIKPNVVEVIEVTPTPTKDQLNELGF